MLSKAERNYPHRILQKVQNIEINYLYTPSLYFRNSPKDTLLVCIEIVKEIIFIVFQYDEMM